MYIHNRKRESKHVSGTAAALLCAHQKFDHHWALPNLLAREIELIQGQRCHRFSGNLWNGVIIRCVGVHVCCCCCCCRKKAEQSCVGGA
jgi:hypothetical protein